MCSARQSKLTNYLLCRHTWHSRHTWNPRHSNSNRDRNSQCPVDIPCQPGHRRRWACWQPVRPCAHSAAALVPFTKQPEAELQAAASLQSCSQDHLTCGHCSCGLQLRASAAGEALTAASQAEPVVPFHCSLSQLHGQQWADHRQLCVCQRLSLSQRICNRCPWSDDPPSHPAPNHAGAAAAVWEPALLPHVC